MWRNDKESKRCDKTEGVKLVNSKWWLVDTVVIYMVSNIHLLPVWYTGIHILTIVKIAITKRNLNKYRNKWTTHVHFWLVLIYSNLANAHYYFLFVLLVVFNLLNFHICSFCLFVCLFLLFCLLFCCPAIFCNVYCNVMLNDV